MPLPENGTLNHGFKPLTFGVTDRIVAWRDKRFTLSRACTIHPRCMSIGSREKKEASHLPLPNHEV